MTGFYSWRLLLMTFHGKSRADEPVLARVHESPMVMLVPLFVLAAGALCAGFIGYDAFVGHNSGEFWNGAITILPGHSALEQAHEAPLWVKLAPLVVGLAGIATAYVMYMLKPDLPGRVAATFSGVYRFLLNKWYFDELYNAIFVRPAFIIGRGLWKGGDGAVIDGVGPDGVAAATIGIAQAARRIAERLHLPLRLRHADRHSRAGLLVRPALSLTGRNEQSADPLARHLPAPRRRGLHRDHPRRARRRRPQRTQRRAADRGDNVRPVARHLVQLRQCASRAFSSSSSRTGCRPSGSPTTWASTASPCCSSC